MKTEQKLCIPEKTLAQHVVVLGKTGAGKSSKLRHIVEHLLSRGKRVCIVDPKGDWYGLKTSADGKSPGFPVIAFGDFKEQKASDVPINSKSGKQIAELITSGNRPCIIGFRGWMPSAMIDFWLDFAPQLFNAQSGEMFLVIDEVHNFAPKGKIQDPQAGKCIHWTNRLMSEGRSLGLVCLIASQRPQKVHNDTLTCCETLIAARVIHKADRDAISDWIDGCGDSDKGSEVLAGLAQLERPQAWVWSPEESFGPKIVTFPMFETFDSFAPPQLQKKISGEGWSTVNLEDVRQKLADVIEEQKSKDPLELQRQLAAARHEIKLLQKSASNLRTLTPPALVKEVPALTDAERTRLTKLIEKIDNFVSSTDAMKLIAEDVVSMKNTATVEIKFFKDLLTGKLSPIVAPVRVVQPIKIQPSVINAVNVGEIKITRKQQDILNAIAWYESVGIMEPSTLQVGAIAQIDSTGGHFSNTVGPLSTAGLVTRNTGTIMLTEAGRKMALVPSNISTLDDYHEMLRQRVRMANSAGGKTIQILDVIINNGNTEISTDAIGQQAQIDHTGGHFSNMIGPLGTLGLITRRAGFVKPTNILFPNHL